MWTTTTYDALDRPIVTMDYTMSAAGPAVTQTDEAGNARRMTHDALGHLVKVEEPNPRNWLGQLRSESHPESGTTIYEYYADGSLQSRTDARGAGFQATYTYDALGRLKTAGYADATPGVTYTYDENTYIGLLTSVLTAGVTSSAFQYNSAGLRTSEQITLSGVSGTFTAAYGYDYAGRLTQITHPSGRVVTRRYASGGDTAVDRISTITDGPTSATLVSSVVDNAAGQITVRTLGGVVAESRVFNTRNQVEHITALASGNTVLDLGYGYGPL
ncbi:MAG TPA: hypothetical protein VFU28_24195, partial [Vicinamibacterales bacterium]|nr:hypothetical protein [Vicinamibacterales bacterium]